MDFINKIKENAIISDLINDIDVTNRESFKIELSLNEVWSLSKVACCVYDSFCNDSDDDDDGLSLEVNHFLDNLQSAIKKLNEAC